MTCSLKIPQNVGQTIVEGGAMFCCMLMNTKKFIKFCRDCGIRISHQRLLRLEQLGVFAPLFQVQAPKESVNPFRIPPGTSDNWFTKGWAIDTSAVPSNHIVPDRADKRCEGYYSMFQIYHLNVVLDRLNIPFDLESFIDWPESQSINREERMVQLAKDGVQFLKRAQFLKNFQNFRIISLLCQHISNRYFPATQTDMRMMNIPLKSRYYDDAWISVNLSIENWLHEMEYWNPQEIKTLYNITSENLKQAYETLSVTQARLDPIEHWYELTQFIAVDSRKRLKGAALLSENMRYGAQMLRLFYKDLYKSDLPHYNEVSRSIFIHLPETSVRKDARCYLEAIANRFNVNPQPRLCLFVEGQTEKTAIEYIFEKYYEIHHGKYGIEIICLNGVDNATGGKRDRFGGIIRLIDYLHEHQTVTFLILDNENRAKTLQKRLGKEHSIHDRRRHVTKKELIEILDNSFEFDNFSRNEIAVALTELAPDNITFSEEDVAHPEGSLNHGSSLGSVYKKKANCGLNKIKLAKILIDKALISGSIANTKIIKILNKVKEIVSDNYLPVCQAMREINLNSGYYGAIKNNPKNHNIKDKKDA